MFMFVVLLAICVHNIGLEKFINKLDERGIRKARKSPVNKRRRIMGGRVQHSIPQAAQQWMIKVSASPAG